VDKDIPQSETRVALQHQLENAESLVDDLRHRLKQPDAGPQTISDTAKALPAPSDRIYKVAVVEDDLADFTLINRLLKDDQRAKFQITHFSNYNEAIRHFDTEIFDVALIDHFLDGKLGTALIRQLGGREAQCPLIMLSGSSSDEIDMAALEAGVADFIEKNDLSGQLLARSIIHACAHFEIERELRDSRRKLRLARDESEAANKEKSEAHERMQDSEERLSAIVDNSPSLIYLKDQNSRFQLVNRAYQ
jgi:DNA-binding response OmpR family regulator